MTSRSADCPSTEPFTVEIAIGAASPGGKPYAPVLMLGKADRSDTALRTNLQRAAIAGGELLSLVARSAVPDRPDGVDHYFAGSLKPGVSFASPVLHP